MQPWSLDIWGQIILCWRAEGLSCTCRVFTTISCLCPWDACGAHTRVSDDNLKTPSDVATGWDGSWGNFQNHISKHLDDKRRKSCHVPQHGWNWRTLRSKSLIIREMPIETTMRYYLTLVRVISIRKSTNNKSWRGCGEKGSLLRCWKECKLVQPLWRTVWGSFKKLKTGLSYDPAIPLLGIYPEKTMIQKDTCTPVFTEALFTADKTWKQANCPSTGDGIKMWYTYT